MHIAQDRLVLLNTGHRKCNKAEITLSVYYNHKPMRLEINYKKEKRKSSKNPQHMEAKKRASKQPMDPLRNYRRSKKDSKRKKKK